MDMVSHESCVGRRPRYPGPAAAVSLANTSYYNANLLRSVAVTAHFTPVPPPLPPLQGAEASRPVEHRHEFFSRTDSLDVWLHHERFHYSLHAIQRDYEWKEKQVIG